VDEAIQKKLAGLEKAFRAAKHLAQNPFTSELARRAAEGLAQTIAAEIADLKWPDSKSMAAD